MNHIWSLLEIDDESYHVDVTWDDPVPNREGGGAYGNFLLSDEAIYDENYGHYGWTALATCDSLKYDGADWVFRSVSHTMHWCHGGIYR